MGLHLRNTLSGEVEAFEPRQRPVSMYFCGLTVSDRAHLGHARSWVHVDVLRRWLEHRGHEVHHVENFTDINEKIVARVGERAAWTDELAVATHYIERTLADMRRVNCRRAHAYPRVSEHIDAIIELIERLIAAGYAYEEDGSVYFDVPAFEGYGQLIDPTLEAEEISTHPDKRHPADFALWKAGTVDRKDIEDYVKRSDLDLEAACAGAKTWSSPWGDGRPGWHIECSAMSMNHLGETFDIHVAGRDIAFPHNENEIAQSEAATGQPFARYWIHIEMLETETEKMSSSLGNYFTVEDAVASWGQDTIRTFLLSASHDTRQAFSESALEEAAARADRLDRAHALATETVDSPEASSTTIDTTLRDTVEQARQDAYTALDDNLDTRGALVALESVVSAINSHVEAGDAPYDYGGLLSSIEVLETIGRAILGINLGASDQVSELTDILDDILRIREALRAAGEYEWADELRNVLHDHNIEIEDTDDGPRARLSSTD